MISRCSPSISWSILPRRNHKTIKGFTPQAMDKMLKYTWPGNVRELMNAVERGVVLSRSEYLDDGALSLTFQVSKEEKPGPEEWSTLQDANGIPLEAVEKKTILTTLAAVGGNKSEAARRLGHYAADAAFETEKIPFNVIMERNHPMAKLEDILTLEHILECIPEPDDDRKNPGLLAIEAGKYFLEAAYGLSYARAVRTGETDNQPAHIRLFHLCGKLPGSGAHDPLAEKNLE